MCHSLHVLSDDPVKINKFYLNFWKINKIKSRNKNRITFDHETSKISAECPWYMRNGFDWNGAFWSPLELFKTDAFII